MIKNRLQMAFALIAALALPACQAQLNSSLPSGAAAYEAIETPPVAEAGAVYTLQPGDVVSVDVFQEPDLKQDKVTIDRAGFLYLPLIGQVQAAGRTQPELSSDIARAYGRSYLRNPSVNVVVNQTMANTVSVEGEVAHPGVFAIQPGASLLTAMALSGSPTKTARLDEVLVFRTVNGQRLGARFDLTEIRAGRAADPQILGGDVVVVGFSAARGIYRDILEAAPLFNIFTRF